MADQTLPIEPGRRRLEALAGVAGEDAIAALRERAQPLKDVRVVHVTAPPFTTAAVDHLTSVVPLLRELGIDASWRAIAGDPAALQAGRALADGLRGGELALDDAGAEAWRAQRVAPDADVVVLHDATALGAAAQRRRADPARWVWRLHGDGSSPAAEAWALARPLVEAVHVRVVAHAALAPPGVDDARAIAPAVDPLAARHLDLPPKVTGAFARAAGLDLTRPTVAAVADLDAWSEPEDAVDAWRAARTRNGPNGLQLALVVRVAHGDERAWRALGELHDYAGARDDLVVVADVAGHGDGAANAAQRLARAVLQDGRDGYDIAASEALWKGTPVVAAPTPALQDQVQHGETGFVAATPAERGARLAELVADPGLAAELAREGHRRVAERHLVTRLLSDELDLLAHVVAPALT